MLRVCHPAYAASSLYCRAGMHFNGPFYYLLMIIMHHCGHARVNQANECLIRDHSSVAEMLLMRVTTIGSCWPAAPVAAGLIPAMLLTVIMHHWGHTRV